MALILESDLEHVERPLADTFTDRVPESAALAATIARLRSDIAHESVSAQALENTLVFYGLGGMGKTTLSKCLQAWLDGDLPEDFHWGAPPEGPFITVRWDLRNPEDRSDPTNFFMDLRTAIGRSCPASFDLALAALFTKRHPDVQRMEQATARSRIVFEVMDALVQGIDALGWASGVGGLGLSSLVRFVKDKTQQAKGIKDAPNLMSLLSFIEREGSDPRKMPVIAGEMMLLLTRYFDRLPVDRRPLLVVFIDTYEQAQSDPTTEQERLVAYAVAKGPLSLFVITGRNQVRWHKMDKAAGPFGARLWPCLAREATSNVEPRQHLVGNLSLEDAQALLGQELRHLGIALSTHDMRSLAESSQGYPVHLDAVTYLAREELRFKEADEIALDDLRASHSETIRRILEHLAPAAERRALLACAVAPFFDVPLVAAIAGVDEGVAFAVVNESLVSERQAEYFPFHLHDRTRELLRLAEEGASFWTPNDWVAAAQRGLDHLEMRHVAALDAEDFELVVAIHALATRMAAEYGLYEAWPASSLLRSPSYEVLRGLVADVDVPFGSKLGDGLAMLSALEFNRGERLQRLTAIMSDLTGEPLLRAMRWRAYALRDLERHDEALEQLTELVAKQPESRLHREQIVHTLRIARRFPDAVAELLRLDVADAPITDGILLAHGKLAEAVSVLQARHTYSLSLKRSHRTRVEMRTRELSARQLLGESVVGSRVLEQALALRIATASCHAALCLGRQEVTSLRFNEVWRELDLLVGFFTGSVENTLVAAELAALRQWATGDAAYMDICCEHGVSGGQTSLWIPVEFLWEHLGSPLPKKPTQWLEPEDVVRQRWLGHYERFIDDLRSRDGH